VRYILYIFYLILYIRIHIGVLCFWTTSKLNLNHIHQLVFLSFWFSDTEWCGKILTRLSPVGISWQGSRWAMKNPRLSTNV